MDSSTYLPSQSQDVVITSSEFNNFPTTTGPSLFDVMTAMDNLTGGIQYIVGLSMQIPGNFTNSYEFAEEAVSKLGGSLDGMAAGNVRSIFAFTNT